MVGLICHLFWYTLGLICHLILILVQALGTLTKTSDPHLQVNILVALRNLSSNLHAKEQIVELQQWPKIVRWADSFDPLVRQNAGLLFAEICEGDESEICREALVDVVKMLKPLIRLNKIEPAVAQTVRPYIHTWTHRF